mgnify:CR=1 FL=1
MRVLVTGGAGFIGGYVVRRLLKLNHDVFNVDKFGYASSILSIDKLFKDKDNKTLGAHHLLKVNLCNLKYIEELVVEVKPDLIIHLAAESHVDRSISGPEEFLKSNVIGTFNLLEASRKYWENLSPKKKETFRFHHVSTDEVFGSLPKDGNFSEDTAYDPRSPYSATKASSDHLVNAWHHTYGLPILLTNCSNNFGPWQFPEKLVPVVITRAYKSKSIPIYGDGLNIRDWLFVEDHVDAIFMVLENGRIGESYCIGGYGEKTNLELVKQICSIMDKKIPSDKPYASLIKFIEDRAGHDKRYAIDPDKITRELGWKPKFSFEKGLEITVEWYLKNQKWCENSLN